MTAAVEIYALENDVVPATLGELEIEHLQRGYARAINSRDLVTRAAYVFVSFDWSCRKAAGIMPAYAYNFLSPEELGKYGVKIDMFICPADENGPPSYGINNSIAGKRWRDIPEDTLIVGDCDKTVFSGEQDLSLRHIRKIGLEHIAQGINKGKSNQQITGSAAITGNTGPDQELKDNRGNRWGLLRRLFELFFKDK